MLLQFYSSILTLFPVSLARSDNKIAERGMEALCLRLPQCVEELTGQSSLVTLELLGNHIGDAGIAALAVAMPSLVELQELYLQNNRFKNIEPLAAVSRE